MTDAFVPRLSRAVLRDGSAPVRVVQVAREVLRDGPAEVRVAQLDRAVLAGRRGETRVSQVARHVLRSHRDSPYPHFPVRLFQPPTLSIVLRDGSVSGGRDLAGAELLEAMDAGGRWTMEFGETAVWTPEKLKTWRMFVAACDGGAMNAIVPMWDRAHAAFQQPKYEGSTTFGQIVWRDTQVWEADEVQAVTAAEAPAGATQISFSFAGGDLIGGEPFSIYGPRYGWRLYMVIRPISNEAGVVTVEIRPPLREWIDADVGLNFDSPRCTMQAVGEIEASMELLRFGTGTARFVESFDRYP